MSMAQTSDLVTNPDTLSDAIGDALLAGGLAAGALLAEHAALWHSPFRLSRPAAYTLGTMTLGIAYSWWAWRRRLLTALLGWWLVAGIGGATVIVAYWVRSVIRAIDERALRAGQIAGSAGRSIRHGHQSAPAPRD